METYGSLWKMQEHSIDRLGNRWAKWPGVMNRNGRRRQNRKERIK